MSLLKQITNLYNHELYSNVIHLAELSLSCLEQKQDVSSFTKFQIYLYYADSLFYLHYYNKAESIYSHALQLRKYIMKPKNGTKNNSDVQNEITSDIDIKYKMFRCYRKLKMDQKAIEILQSISPRSRTPKVNMALGDLFKEGGFERSAIACYREVLRECPAAIEAAENLLSLEASGTEVHSLMLEATTDMSWLNTWLRGQSQMHSRDYSNAIQIFKSITTLKDNSAMAVTLAYCYIYLCDEKKALACLQRALQLNPNLIKGRDLLANLLARSTEKEQLKDLEKLVNVDIDTLQWTSEHWAAMGWYMYSIKKYERATYFGYQAVSLNPKNVEAFLLKAQTFLQIFKYNDAKLHFKEVVVHNPYRFEGYKGLVESCIILSKVKEAITVAANSCRLLNNPQALTLYASALMKEPVTTNKVRNLLDKALTADPSYTPAVCLLAEYLDQEQRHEEACTILQKHLEKYPSSRIHQILADCYSRLQKDDEAFAHYSAALRLDPNNQRAMEGLNGLGRTPTKLDSSYYMSVTGESSSYTSQGQSVPSDELEESDSELWPTNSEFMSFD